MPRYRRRRRRTWVRPAWLLGLALLLAASIWGSYLRGLWSAAPRQAVATGPRPALTTDRPERPAPSRPRPGITEKGDTPKPPPALEATDARARAASLVAAGKQALGRSDLVAARTYFSEAMQLGVDEPELSLLRAELTRIGNDTVFSPRIFPNDPFVERYVIRSGDTLGKIAKAHRVSPDLLAGLNHIKNPDAIRAGQSIKVVQGPFHAAVDMSDYVLDVFLGSTFVTHFTVGLGVDGSTPTGTWRVTTKLKNPTYYHPRGGDIIAADDPNNPLGERWIGLEGTSGQAMGQERYGIHGTIEPESIGQSVSLGCIRLHNEDVEALYTYLIERHSTVTMRE